MLVSCVLIPGPIAKTFIFAFKDFSETSLKIGAGLSLQTPLFPPHRYFCTCWTVLSCAGRGVGLGDDACTSL